MVAGVGDPGPASSRPATTKPKQACFGASNPQRMSSRGGGATDGEKVVATIGTLGAGGPITRENFRSVLKEPGARD